jgi:signal transduction histidine kinase
VLTIVLLLQKKPWTKYLALYSFSALMLTKTVVWFGLLPALLYLLWLKRKMLFVFHDDLSRLFIEHSGLNLRSHLPIRLGTFFSSSSVIARYCV